MGNSDINGLARPICSNLGSDALYPHQGHHLSGNPRSEVWSTLHTLLHRAGCHWHTCPCIRPACQGVVVSIPLGSIPCPCQGCWIPSHHVMSHTCCGPCYP